jgi:hypothetical protein
LRAARRQLTRQTSLAAESNPVDTDADIVRRAETGRQIDNTTTTSMGDKTGIANSSRLVKGVTRGTKHVTK